MYESVPMQELCWERQKSKRWLQFLNINHEITIEVFIKQIIPVFKSRQINPNPINFDSLRFHLYHADQSYSSSILQYHPKHNIFKEGDILQGKMMKDDRSIKLNIRHEIRHQNIELYKGIFETTSIKIVAETSYGLILGIADVYLDDLSSRNDKVLNEYRCVSFNSLQFDQNGQILTSQRILLAKINLSIESTPIAPLLQDLKLNAQAQIQKRKTSKSKSPNRLISQSPSRAPSPKKKRLLLAQLSSAMHQMTHLTIFEGVEYRYNLGSTAVKREITYRQVKNIKQRKIELTKINEQYFVKCYLLRSNPDERGFMHFQLNEQKFMVYPITDKAYSIIDYQTYFRAKERKAQLHNKLLRVGSKTLLLPRENNRIIKNPVKQSAVDGLLSSVFIKTPFEQCQIYAQGPFILQDIAHKEGGYMLGYYYSTSRAILSERQSQLVVFLKSKFKQTNQIHVFQCTVSPRIAGRDTILKQLRVSHSQKFIKMSLELMANENVEYQIRSTSLAVSVVNGQNYQFSSYTPDLILQLHHDLETANQFDLVFTDSKLRCFFVRVHVIVEEEG